jgi:hypothetical protein
LAFQLHIKAEFARILVIPSLFYRLEATISIRIPLSKQFTMLWAHIITRDAMALSLLNDLPWAQSINAISSIMLLDLTGAHILHAMALLLLLNLTWAQSINAISSIMLLDLTGAHILHATSLLLLLNLSCAQSINAMSLLLLLNLT